jgi:hypothetical protein
MQSAFTFLTGLLTGILVSAAGAYFHRLGDKKKKQEELLFQVYMRLLDLSASHFWIVSREMNREQPNRDHARRFSDIRWQIADALRQTDGLPELREILSVMFSVRFASERDRHQELNRLVDLVGDRVNPRYNKAIREVDTENQKVLTENLDEYVRRQKWLER